MLPLSRLRRQNDEVYYIDSQFSAVDAECLTLLKTLAADTPRKRCRFCFHADPSATLHQMLIAHHCDAYVRPHRHLHKPESLCVLEGEADVFVFDDAGRVIRSVRMAPFTTGGTGYCWMPEKVWHNLVIRSEWLLFLEATQGPFEPAGTEFPAWAPDDADDAAAYIETLSATAPAVS